MLAAVTVLMTGCMTPSDVSKRFQFVERPAQSNDRAIVYVYRVAKTEDVRVGNVDISIDGKSIFAAKSLGFTWFYLAPGSYELRAEWPLLDKPLFEEGHFDPKVLRLTVEAKRTYYVNYQVIYGSEPESFLANSGVIGKALSKSRVVSAGLVLEPESVAQQNLAYCSAQTNNFGASKY